MDIPTFPVRVDLADVSASMHRASIVVCDQPDAFGKMAARNAIRMASTQSAEPDFRHVKLPVRLNIRLEGERETIPCEANVEEAMPLHGLLMGLAFLPDFSNHVPSDAGQFPAYYVMLLGTSTQVSASHLLRVDDPRCALGDIHMFAAAANLLIPVT